MHAVLLPGDRLALDARPGLELPELVPVIGVESLEFARSRPVNTTPPAVESTPANRGTPLVTDQSWGC